MILENKGLSTQSEAKQLMHHHDCSRSVFHTHFSKPLRHTAPASWETPPAAPHDTAQGFFPPAGVYTVGGWQQKLHYQPLFCS